MRITASARGLGMALCGCIVHARPLGLDSQYKSDLSVLSVQVLHEWCGAAFHTRKRHCHSVNHCPLFRRDFQDPIIPHCLRVF